MEFYSSGKLMLTGEYVVLAGATALSIPTKRGAIHAGDSIQKDHPSIGNQSTITVIVGSKTSFRFGIYR